MGEPENVSELPRKLPREVELRQDEVSTPRFTPRDLKMIKAQTGRTFTQLITDENSDEKFVIVAWLKLRREGYDLTIEEMEDVLITIIGGQQDPTSEQPSTTSQLSASTGE